MTLGKQLWTPPPGSPETDCGAVAYRTIQTRCVRCVRRVVPFFILYILYLSILFSVRLFAWWTCHTRLVLMVPWILVCLFEKRMNRMYCAHPVWKALNLFLINSWEKVIDTDTHMFLYLWK